MKILHIAILFSIVLFTSCNTRPVTPFDKGNKWYSVYDNRKMPIIINDSIYTYMVDTNLLGKPESIDEYYEKLSQSLKLNKIVKFTYDDSTIKYVEADIDTPSKFDTVIRSYKLVAIDSIKLLKIGSEYLCPWSQNEVTGKAEYKKLTDVCPKMELAGFKIGQQIDNNHWRKTGEEVKSQFGCIIGKYTNTDDNDITAEVYNNLIVSIRYEGFYDGEAEELKKLYKHYENDTSGKRSADMEKYFEEFWSAHSNNDTYFSMYKTKEHRVYGYLISSSKYSAHLENDSYLKLLTILKHTKSNPQ